MKSTFLFLSLGLLLSFSLPEKAEAQLRLQLDTSSITLPAVGLFNLEEGYVERGNNQGIYALKFRVDTPVGGSPWALYLKATNAYLVPQSFGKSCRDLQWKFDEEGHNAYRPLTVQEQIVAFRAAGGPMERELDFLLRVDWATPPSTYSLNLMITLVAE